MARRTSQDSPLLGGCGGGHLKTHVDVEVDGTDDDIATDIIHAKYLQLISPGSKRWKVS